MNHRPILKNKVYLYLTEFFSGVSVMAVELGASRLLAPYFSSSQIVWTIIIGTIMIALALGNLWGGRTADKNPDTDRLYRIQSLCGRTNRRTDSIAACSHTDLFACTEYEQCDFIR